MQEVWRGLAVLSPEDSSSCEFRASDYLVTDLGDGYLLVFRTVIHAFDFVLQLRSAPGHQLVAVHAGVSVGPVTVKNNTVYGETVSFAARLESVAQRDEICVCA